MPQLLKGETFVNGQQVQDYRLNQLVDSAQLLVGAISEQPAMTANTVEASDQTLINDGGVLKRTTFGDVLNSNLPATNTTVTTSVVNGATNKDVVITPNDGVVVSGKVFTSADGITTTVTSAEHGLTTGQIVTITASVSSYSGQFIITVTGVDTFTYVIPAQIPAVTAASGTCSYTKEGAVIINGHARVNENFYLSGNTTTIGTLTTRGSLMSVGEADFTGTLKVNGTVGYVLTEIVEETIPTTSSVLVNAWTTKWTSASYTKPAGEIWIVETNANFSYEIVNWHCVVLNQAITLPSVSTTTLDGNYFNEGGPSNYHHHDKLDLRYVFNSASSFTCTFKLDYFSYHAVYSHTLSPTAFMQPTYLTGITIPLSKFTIYKYKTA